MNPSPQEYQNAIEVLKESLPYNLQRRDPRTGIWRSIGKSVRGRTAANLLLNAAKKNRRAGEDETDFRVLPKNEADKYREGLAAGQGLIGESRRRRPVRFVPEHV
jgi:hypothetical protein